VLENRDLTDYMRAFRLRLEGDRHETFEPERTDEDGRLAPFVALAARLVAAVREGTSVSPSFEEGLRAQRIAEAVEESDRTEAWVATT
jgi:predicted dehydrogenase